SPVDLLYRVDNPSSEFEHGIVHGRGTANEYTLSGRPSTSIIDSAEVSKNSCNVLLDIRCEVLDRIDTEVRHSGLDTGTNTSGHGRHFTQVRHLHLCEDVSQRREINITHEAAYVASKVSECILKGID